MIIEQLAYRSIGSNEVVVGENRKVSGDVEVPVSVREGETAYTVTALGHCAFSQAEGISGLFFPEGSQVREFGRRSLQNSGLVRLRLPPGLTRFDEDTFRHTPKLEEVQSAGNANFSSVDGVLYDSTQAVLIFCPRTRSAPLEVPASVTTIGGWAFNGCSSLHRVTFTGSSLRTIQAGAFAESGVQAIDIPASVALLGSECFLECKALKAVRFSPESPLEELPFSAFAGSGIESMTVPPRVRCLRSRCLLRTYWLRSLDLANVEVIEADVIAATGLEELTIPSTCRDLGPNNFFCTESLQKVNLSPGNPTYKLRDGFLTTQDDRVCLYAPRSTKAVAFWQGCEVISGHAFYQSRHLTRVQFLTDCRIREIGWGAFRFSGITELEVPRSVKTIGHDAFADCSQLTSLTFEAESELHTIGNSAFALTGIVQCHLPQSLRVLGHSAFACCPELRLVVLPAGVARVDRMTFYTCPKLSSVVSEARTKVTVAATALERADAAVVYTRPGVVVDGGDGLKVETPDSLEAVSRLVDYAQPERTKRHASSVSALAVKRDAYVRVEEAPIFRGTAATVYQMQDKATGKRLAGKQLVVGTDRALAQFMLEVETLFQLIHPMVLGIIGYVMPRANEAWIYTEWAENGSLKDQLLAGTLDATTKAKIMAGVVIGMRHIHECGVLHRDLKPGNVLLVRDFDVRIGDFGSAKNSDADSSMTTDVGSPMYQAPELGRTPAQYDHRVDMFSFGVMLWEVVTGKVPFSGRDGRTILTAVQTGKRPEEGLLGRPFPQGLIAACWDEEPSARPEFAEIFAIMKANDWAILPGVDSSEVAAYVQKTLKEAAAYPPSKIERDRWKLA